MLKNKGNYFILETEHTAMLVSAETDAACLYYGEKLCDYTGAESLRTAPLFSQWENGDFREPSLLIRHADDSAASDFRLKSARIAKRVLPEGLPSSYGEEKCLRLEFADQAAKLRYVLQLTAYADCDAISASAFLTNAGKKAVTVERFSSLQLEFSGSGFSIKTFGGGSETGRTLGAGAFENASFGGASSLSHNPFVMLSRGRECYGVQLLYSGNHRETAEEYGGRTRLIAGINPFCFSWELNEGETFFAPEAVFCFGRDEEGTLLRMRRFLARHVVRERLREKERPVTFYCAAEGFAPSRGAVSENARRAAEVGAELFVLDYDGARGAETDGENGDGTESLLDEVRAAGLAFGIRIEPETVSEESELYRRHPEYCLKIPRREPKIVNGRRMLNLADPQVQGYVFRAVSRAIVQTKAAYVRWHCPRGMTDCYDKSARGSEFYHRYTLGLYNILSRLVERYPKVLFELSGGRSDAGLLRYLSFCADGAAAERLIRLYPLCGVALPVAEFGGDFSGDLAATSQAEFSALKARIGLYKRYRKALQCGTVYPLVPTTGERPGFLCVGQNGAVAVAAVPVGTGDCRVAGRAFDEKAYYRISAVGQNGELSPIVVASGDLLNRAGMPFSESGSSGKGEDFRPYVFEKIAKKSLDRENRI